MTWLRGHIPRPPIPTPDEHSDCAGHCWECEQCLGDQGHEVVEFITPPTVGERSTVLSWCLDCAEELEIS